MAAFQHHPYRHEVIGSIEDLKAITRNELYEHYRKYYNPANAVVTVAGDFDTAEMLDKIKAAYGGLKGQALPPLELLREDKMAGEQHVDVYGPGETTYLQIAYRAPAAKENDFFAFTILDSLLTGPNSLNMFGGGSISNKTSRLYRRLVEKEFAISVNGSLQATVDPYIYTISITVHPDHSAQEVLEQVDQELDRLRQHWATQAEVERAAKQARALFVYGSENITNQGFWLGYSEIFAQYSWFLNYTDKLSRITADDVRNILHQYLNPAQRVIGIYHPEEA